MLLTYFGEVYVWGKNDKGQLGLGDYIQRNTPHKLNLPHSVVVKDIFCGTNYSILLACSNDVYVWGVNDCAQLGLGDYHNRSTPHKLNFPHSVVVKQFFVEVIIQWH